MLRPPARSTLVNLRFLALLLDRLFRPRHEAYLSLAEACKQSGRLLLCSLPLRSTLRTAAIFSSCCPLASPHLGSRLCPKIPAVSRFRWAASAQSSVPDFLHEKCMGISDRRGSQGLQARVRWFGFLSGLFERMT